MKKVAFLLGAPCSGKGTQGNLLKSNFFVISAGEILRQKYPQGSEIRAKLDNGELIDTSIIGNAIISEIENSQKDYVIIDGFPRILEQAQLIKKLIEEKKILSTHIIVIDCKKENLIKRMHSRTMCDNCQMTYDKLETCCGSKTSKRKDDNEAVFKKRYEIYNKDFELIFHLLKNSIVFNILDGSREIHHIHEDIKKILI